MSSPDSDITFAGSIPKVYESYLVPLIFAPFAGDMAARLAQHSVSSVLEIAAGTGVVTRALASALPENVSIVATDLNEAMLEHAQSVGTSRPVEWRQADAAALPFPDETFDAVICQFGVMFFPDKAKAFAEAHRVLRPGGVFLFDVWDRIEENQFVNTVTTALEPIFPRSRRVFMLAFLTVIALAPSWRGIWQRAGLLRSPISRPWRSGVRPGLPEWWR